MRVLVDGQAVSMRPDVFNIFMCMWNARGGLRSQAELYDSLASADSADPPLEGIIHVYITYLRQSLCGTRFRVGCAPGRGWKLERVEP